MLSPRAPLSVKNEKTLSSQMNNISLDKENTVRAKLLKLPFHEFFKCRAVRSEFRFQCVEVKVMAAIS